MVRSWTVSLTCAVIGALVSNCQFRSRSKAPTAYSEPSRLAKFTRRPVEYAVVVISLLVR